MPLKTTQGNISDLKEGIPWSTIPKTFQDAITIVRQLGEKYIWIDSLCIIQDDLDDWYRESAKMSQIYQNSYLTIAATKSKDSNGGCYSDQDVRCNSKPICALDKDGDPFTIYCRQKLPHWGSGSQHVRDIIARQDEFPLLMRAWVYQERFLSPRVLHFGSQELIWECMEAAYCECGSFDSYRSGEKPKMSHAYASRGADRIFWNMIMEYSALKLTKPSDRLPAFSGLAKQIQALNGDTYIAGLWKTSFINDLQWRCHFPEEAKRSLDQGVPTWSWASMDCYLFGPASNHEELLVSVYNVEVSPLSDDPFGRVASGFLVIGGPVISARLKYFPPQERSRSRYALVPESCRQEVVVEFPDYDYSSPGPEFIGDGELLYCLKLHNRFSLVLRCVDEDSSTFKRVGAAENNLWREYIKWVCVPAKNMYLGARERKLTII
ncbi:hypothetical protein EG329_008484 [Mollisiaceae sp. DMI_Dod_QoI]|nr:hypothetical protein EG329_008484 [Helotiales sp. DMI_Dod_QoI]